MPHQQSSSNVIMLILLRISLILVATLAALLTTTHYMSHDDLPLGKTWLLLVTVSGCLFIGSELITLFRLLTIQARRGKPGLVSGD